MMDTPSLTPPAFRSPDLSIAAEQAAVAIARLDARFLASPVQSAWQLRAAWAGYAAALQLQGIEIDPIDVFSWGCGLPLPDRPRRTSHGDEFGAFAEWQVMSHENFAAWRDSQPFAPVADLTLPMSLRAIDMLRQRAAWDRGISAWLTMPRLLQGVGLCRQPLSCLIGGTKALRLTPRPGADAVRSACRALTKAAEDGLELLDEMEAQHRRACRAIGAERVAGALPRLLALSLAIPLLSPVRVAAELELSVPGASKLLARAEALGLLVEVSGRRAWKAYLPPDLAIAFGYRSAPRGRPRLEAPAEQALTETYEDFDREMAAINERLARLGHHTQS